MTGLDKFLFWYTILFALIITGSTISRGFSPSNLILLALFLPLTIFTILQAVKRYYLWKSNKIASRNELDPSADPCTDTPHASFSLKTFFSQKNLFFTLTLILFFVAVLLSIIRFLNL